MLKFFGFAKSGPITDKDQLNNKIDEVKLNDEETIKKLFGNLLSKHADTDITTLTGNFHFQIIIDQLKEKQQVKIQFSPFNVSFIYLLALAILKQDYQDYLIVSLAQNFTPDSQSEQQLNYLTTSIQDTTPYSNPDLAQQIATSVLKQLKASNEKLLDENHPDNTEEQESEITTVIPDTSGQQVEVDTSSSSTLQPPVPPPPPPLPQDGVIRPKTYVPPQSTLTAPSTHEDRKPLNDARSFVPSPQDIKKQLKQLGTGQAPGYFKFPVTRGSGKHWPDPTTKSQSKPALTETATQPPTIGGVDTSSISREQQFAAARAVFSQKAQELSQKVTNLDASLTTKPKIAFKIIFNRNANKLRELRISKFKNLTIIANSYMQTIGEEDSLAHQLMEQKIAFYQKLGEQERQLTPLDPNTIKSEEDHSIWEQEYQTEIKQAQQYQTDTLFQANLFNSFIKEIKPILVQMYTNIKENADAQELIKEIKAILPDIEDHCVDAVDTAPRPLPLLC
jgi:hypothetical protein